MSRERIAYARSRNLQTSNRWVALSFMTIAVRDEFEMDFKGQFSPVQRIIASANIA